MERADEDEMEVTWEELQKEIQEEVENSVVQKRTQLAQLQTLMEKREKRAVALRKLSTHACESVVECEAAMKELYSRLGMEYRDTDSEDEGAGGQNAIIEIDYNDGAVANNHDDALDCDAVPQSPRAVNLPGSHAPSPLTTDGRTAQSEERPKTSKTWDTDSQREEAYISLARNERAVVVLTRLPECKIRVALNPPKPQEHRSEEEDLISNDSDAQWEPPGGGSSDSDHSYSESDSRKKREKPKRGKLNKDIRKTAAPQAHTDARKGCAVVVLTRLPERKKRVALNPPRPQEHRSEEEDLISNDSDVQWEPPGGGSSDSDHSYSESDSRNKREKPKRGKLNKDIRKTAAPQAHTDARKGRAVVVLTRLPERKKRVALNPPKPQEHRSEEEDLISNDSDVQWEPPGGGSSDSDHSCSESDSRKKREKPKRGKLNKDVRKTAAPQAHTDATNPTEWELRRSSSQHVSVIMAPQRANRRDNCGESCSAESSVKPDQHSPTGGKPYHCDQCGSRFSRKDTLRAHQRIHTGGKPYHCDQCGSRFSRKDALRAHQCIHTGGKPYHCDQCGSRFSRKDALRAHQRIHTGEKPYHCEQCGKSFTTNAELSGHQRVHTGEKPYQCEQCGKSFTRKTHLSRHQRVHTGEKSYHCEQCGKSYATESQLRVHYVVHTGERPYHCDQCGSSFSRKDALRAHQRIHTGEKPYHCDQCERKFTAAGDLKKHQQQTHMGEKPYRCDLCGNTFARKNTLTKHQRIHTAEKPYHCDRCGKGFRVPFTLSQHMKTHTKKKPHHCECDQCQKSFTSF